jgi:hypothetical protein
LIMPGSSNIEGQQALAPRMLRLDARLRLVPSACGVGQHHTSQT